MAKGKMYYILMADIKDSRRSDKPKALLASFSNIVQIINKRYKKSILSPLTITLGDEFQGVILNIESAIEIIFEIDKLILDSKMKFELKYVLHYGSIETELNKKSAHEMIGKGLTYSREQLELLKHTNRRIFISVKDAQKSQMLNLAFQVTDGISKSWPEKDSKFVSDFLELEDYKLVAEKHKMDASQVYKRRKTLLIQEYFNQKKLIKLIAK